mmetsp:Transcript_4421/g.15368  ORF Transcript_4421/g.15368 Transcript_4421/m.15368 type:complete len:112 (-) Transcript_4421:1065-1400(-)
MGTLSCSTCGLEVKYTYRGRNPPYAPTLALLEEAYCIPDPFVGSRAGMEGGVGALVLGADCSACARPVCAAATCSFFYAKRFCFACAAQAAQAFPPEIQKDIRKGIERSGR